MIRTSDPRWKGPTGVFRAGATFQEPEGWGPGEAGEEQPVIIDGTSAELQVSVTSLVSRGLTDDLTQ